MERLADSINKLIEWLLGKLDLQLVENIIISPQTDCYLTNLTFEKNVIHNFFRVFWKLPFI